LVEIGGVAISVETVLCLENTFWVCFAKAMGNFWVSFAKQTMDPWLALFWVSYMNETGFWGNCLGFWENCLKTTVLETVFQRQFQRQFFESHAWMRLVFGTVFSKTRQFEKLSFKDSFHWISREGRSLCAHLSKNEYEGVKTDFKKNDTHTPASKVRRTHPYMPALFSRTHLFFLFGRRKKSEHRKILFRIHKSLPPCFFVTHRGEKNWNREYLREKGLRVSLEGFL